jgi:HEAT repeat protein
VRQTAALTLGKMKARQSIPKLRESLNDSSPPVSFAAARSLWQLGDHSGRDVFIDVLAGERRASDGLIKGNLKGTYKKYHSPTALALLGAKEAAGALFGPLGYGIMAAEELAKDRSASARALSASLLAADPNPDCVRELKDALQDKNWTVRAAAAEALGKMPHLAQTRDLEPLLNDDKEAVRLMAAGSIVRLSQSERKKKVGQPESQSEYTTATRN